MLADDPPPEPAPHPQAAVRPLCFLGTIEFAARQPLPTPQKCLQNNSLRGITGKQFLLDNVVLGHCHGRNEHDNNQRQHANYGIGRTGRRRPGLRHPRLRAHLRPVAWPGQGRREIRRLPPHPVALPGAWTPGEITAQGGDQGRWRRPGRHRSSGVAHDRRPRDPRRAAANPKPLAETLEDALRLLCAAPLATVEELSSFGGIPETTLRRRLAKFAERGLADSVVRHLGSLGSNPRRRHFPTEKGIEAAADVEHGVERFLSEYPVSREWFRILTHRLDPGAVLCPVAAVIARADPEQQPVRVDHYRQGPYDLLITLSAGRSLGILRQGAVLSSGNLRYRLRTLEQLGTRQRPTATLIFTHSDQATRRAFRPWATPANTAAPS